MSEQTQIKAKVTKNLKLNHLNLYKKFGYAFRGIRYAIESEINLSLQFLIGIVFFIIAIYFSRYGAAIANFVLMSLILALEMLNTAIENVCDLVQPEYSPKVKIIKDLSAGAVLIVAISWSIILLYILTVLFDPNFSINQF